MDEILKWIALLLALWLLNLFYKEASDSWENEKGQAQGRGSQGGQTRPSSDLDNQGRSSDSEYQQTQNQGKIRDLLKKDPSLAQELMRKAGLASLPADKILENPDLVKKIAERLSQTVIDIFEVTSRQPALNIDLNSTQRLIEVPNGGVVKSLVPIQGLSEIKKVRPKDYAYPRSARYQRIVSGQAQKIMHRDLVTDQKIFYVLEDGSGSMIQYSMNDGNRRFVWARGVILKLAYQALAGNSKFMYRMFDAEPKSLYTVTNQVEAQKFLDYALSTGPTEGGTRILIALARAVEDIRSDTGEFSKADILLVSDGQDETISDLDSLNRLLGGDIDLHVIIIGGDENPYLKAVAKTYQIFN